MQLRNVCLVTADLPRLRSFYEMVLQMRAEGDDLYSSFAVSGIGLGIFTIQGMEAMAPGSMAGAGAGNVVIEFQIEDADDAYARLKGLGVPIVKPPTTEPWGSRSAWFRDPDGNIVNLYARVEAPEG